MMKLNNQELTNEEIIIINQIITEGSTGEQHSQIKRLIEKYNLPIDTNCGCKSLQKIKMREDFIQYLNSQNVE